MSKVCEICGCYTDTAAHAKGCAEVKFTRKYDPSAFPPFAVTVDLAIFTIREGSLQVLLIERGDEPFKGYWALPGGFVNPNESADQAAVRELAEETGVDVPLLNNLRTKIVTGSASEADTSKQIHLEQLKTYSAPKRDPRMRVVSVAHVAFAANMPEPQAGDDAAKARWWPVEDVVGEEPEIFLAFDHRVILADALERVKSKLEYTTLAAQFVEEPFTLSDLRRVYKIVWDEEPPLANFRRKVLSVEGFVEPIGELSTGKSGPRALLYKRGPAEVMQPAMMRKDVAKEEE